mmetsp:Transcript_27429/g.46182  ORF Transcript_27429/g.46182 Transcript_27429/m.46182 type:complete len:200 (-) Transcript_27429:183-782(-)
MAIGGIVPTPIISLHLTLPLASRYVSITYPPTNPSKIPTFMQISKQQTRAPRTSAGTNSARYTGAITKVAPTPEPMIPRATRSIEKSVLAAISPVPIANAIQATIIAIFRPNTSASCPKGRAPSPAIKFKLPAMMPTWKLSISKASFIRGSAPDIIPTSYPSRIEVRLHVATHSARLPHAYLDPVPKKLGFGTVSSRTR